MRSFTVCYLTRYYSGDDQMKKFEKGGACSMCETVEMYTRVLVGRPEGKRSLGRPRR